MVMQANPNDTPDREPEVARLFPDGEGRTKTLGVSFPPSIAAAIRRTGNRGKSISDQLLGLMDPQKLEQLLQEDRERQQRFAAN